MSMKLKSRIMHKGTRGHKITEKQQRINVAISKTRYKVERTFGSMHRWFGAGIARYIGLSKTHAQHIMESIAYNLYRTPGIIVSIREIIKQNSINKRIFENKRMKLQHK